MKALNLTHCGVKQARRHPAIAGKKPIARGTFAAIFEGSRPDTVWKMTVDSKSFYLSNCTAAKCEGPHFPKVVKSHWEIGETKIRGEDYPIFLYEVERLKPVQSAANKKLRNKIMRIGGQASGKVSQYQVPYDQLTQPRTQEMLHMAIDDDVGQSVIDALDQLNRFAMSYDGMTIDLHRGNFMESDDGTLVLNDPVCDWNLLKSLRKELKFL